MPPSNLPPCHRTFNRPFGLVPGLVAMQLHRQLAAEMEKRTRFLRVPANKRKSGVILRAPMLRCSLMALTHKTTMLLLAVLPGFMVLPLSAQENAGHTGPKAATSKTSPAVLTGKERLGRKWMDEQRIDNCNVPIEKRGTKPRPTICHHQPTG